MHFIDYIYFFYGLAFFLFGYSILHYPTENSIFRFARDAKYLGLFGILHGIYEWIAMIRQMEQGAIKETFAEVGFIVMSLSYGVLLFFALRIMFGRPRAVKILTAVILVWLSVVVLESHSFKNIDIITRYILGASGIFLTAYVFSRPVYIVQGTAYAAVKPYVKSLAVIFFIYGVLGGIIVPEGPFFPASVMNAEAFKTLTGLPIQLFRGLCAIAANIAIIQILHIFKNKTDMHLLKLSKALEESGDTVVITDIEGRIEYVNRLFGEQTGYSADEVIGKNPKFLQSGEHHEPFYEHLWTTILSGKNYRNVIINKRKDGTLYHEYKTIVPLKNSRGEIINFISTGKDITSRIIFENELAKAAATDPLTGAANRLQCDRWLKRAIEHAQKNQSPITLIMFDIDDFKHVNDTFGHNAGDDVLVSIADIVRAIVRSSDMFARWGGEEFVILQIDTPIEGTAALAERLRQEIERSPLDPVGKITISLGVAAYEEGESIEAFVKKVDEAMYQAKKAGKNRVVVADENEKKIAQKI